MSVSRVKSLSSGGKALIVDIETDKLFDATKVWCVVTKDIQTNEVRTYADREGYESFGDLQRLLVSSDWYVIGHNFLRFDRIWLADLLGISVRPDRIIDTLVLSKLLKSSIDNGHSLEAWGERLRFPKGSGIDFSKFSDEMVKYCVNDVHLNHKLFTFLMKKLDREEFYEAIEIEHQMVGICDDMSKNGFTFKVAEANALLDEINKKLDALDRQLLDAFPPKSKLIREYTPKLTKHGTISRTSVPRDWIDLSIVQAGCPFSLVTWEPFNPGSPKQIVERLNDAGWQPTSKTKGHLDAIKNGEDLTEYLKTGWKVDEENLQTLPEDAPPAARQLVHRLFLSGRQRTLKEWLAVVKADGKIHAKFEPIGTWTHRMSHNSPNLGNVAAPKSIKYKAKDIQDEAIRLGKEMRALWTTSSSDHWLVGTDAVGIQLRIFAHYINDPNFTEALINGDNKLGTDAHTLNARTLGISRDLAKTFIYAFLLGAGDAKIGDILGGGTRRGREAKRAFVEAYPGLRTLRSETIPRDAKRGYFRSFDGRLVACDSQHLMMAGYLQTGEAVIMKHANILWRQRLEEKGIEYKQVNFVHDEWQTEIRGDRELAELVGNIQAMAIKDVGERFKLNCPMAGEFKVGKNWYETH